MQQCMGCMEQMEDLLTVCPHCGYEKGTPPKEAYHMPPESILASRYIVGRVLGYGGFGVTYIGWDAQLLRKVAIKEFLPSSFATRMPGYTEITVYGGEATLQFEAGLSRFTDEARRLAAFNSIPGIVDIYDTFVENNTAYIVMQFLQGRDVKAILAEKGSYTFEEALPIIVEICNTLEPVHKAEIIHRDIAPDNIYITKEGEVKLLDFGASRFATSVNSKSLSVILKSGYAPEEQYRSRGDQGPWSDVYALAATFYKMLTGVTPEDSMERAIRDELKEPSQLGAELPKDAENAIMNALNIRKENRIMSVAEFRRALTGDKVNRVKEKAVRSDSGALPLWGKLLIAGTLVLTLGFGLLTVTGVVDFGQGNLLADTFGSGIPEGFVNAPGVVNQMEPQAQKSAKKAGLTYLIVGTQYSDDIEKGRILSQEPLPGRLIEKGKELQVNISGGSREEAMAAGEMKLPDLTYMTVAEASYQISQAGYRGANVLYDYSDTIAEGLVISYEEGYVTTLTVSAGKNDADQKTGSVRAPAIFVNGTGNTVLGFAVASVQDTQYQEDEQRMEYHLLISVDGGATWQRPEERYQNYPRNSAYYYTGDYFKVARQELDLESFILHWFPDYMGKEVMVKLERWWENDFWDSYYNQTEESKMPIDSTVVSQKFRPIRGETNLRVNQAEAMTWEEFGKLYEKNPDLRYTMTGGEYQYDKENNQLDENRWPIRIKGNFKSGRNYKTAMREHELFDISPGNRVDSCVIDGEIFMTAYTWNPVLEGTASLFVWEVGTSEVTETGDIDTVLPPAAECLFINGEIQEPAVGRQLTSILSNTFRDRYYPNLTFLADDTYAEGEIISYMLSESTHRILLSTGSLENREYRLRAPVLLRTGSEYMEIKYVVLPDDSGESYYNIALYGAGKDQNWIELDSSNRELGGSLEAGIKEEHQSYLYLSLESLKEKMPQRGEAISFKIELRNEQDVLLENRTLNQTITINNMQPMPAVSSVSRLSPSELTALAEGGKITMDNSQAYYMYLNRKGDPNFVPSEIAYLLKGDFQKGKSYRLRYKSEESPRETRAVCETEGELIVTIAPFDNKEVEEMDSIEIQLLHFTVSENGSYTIVQSDYGTITSLFR